MGTVCSKAICILCGKCGRFLRKRERYAAWQGGLYLCALHYLDWAVRLEHDKATREVLRAWSCVTRALIRRRTPSTAAMALEIFRQRNQVTPSCGVDSDDSMPPLVFDSDDSMPPVVYDSPSSEENERAQSDSSSDESERPSLEPFVGCVYVCFNYRNLQAVAYSIRV